jgi:hypothetical protein
VIHHSALLKTSLGTLQCFILLITARPIMQTIQSTAIKLWSASTANQSRASYTFVKHAEPCFLLLLSFPHPQHSQISIANELLAIALSEQACLGFQPINNSSLWEITSQAIGTNLCHIYLNLDLLTIDAQAQDWGDYKIKPEQVEFQRNELTHAALFNPRFGFVVQVLKAALPTFMDMLRAANLAHSSDTIGKTWGEVAAGQAVLDIYRDAKKQASFSAQHLLESTTQRLTT